MIDMLNGTLQNETVESFIEDIAHQKIVFFVGQEKRMINQ
jgi:hypothetical protein